MSPAPLLDRTTVDPYLTASPWVIVEDGMLADVVRVRDRMGASAGGTRGIATTSSTPSRATDCDWDRQGVVCIDYRRRSEHAFGRPCVLRDGDRYRMWYSYRGERYRIGYAESADGIAWTRMDAMSVVDVSDDAAGIPR